MDSSAVFAVFLAGLLQLQQWLLDFPASIMAALSAYATPENFVVLLVALPWIFFLFSLLIVLRYGQVTFPASPTSLDSSSAPPSPAAASLPARVDVIDWEMRYGNLDKDNTTLIDKCRLMEQNLERLRDERRHLKGERAHLDRRLKQAQDDLRTAREEQKDPTSSAAYAELQNEKDILEARKAKLERANKDLQKKLADREAAYQDLLAVKDDLQAKKGALSTERFLHQQTQNKVLDLTADCERLAGGRVARKGPEGAERSLCSLELKARDAAQHQRQLDTKLRKQAENGAKELERTLGERDRTVKELRGRIEALEEAEKRALHAADSSSRGLKAAREALTDVGKAHKKSIQGWEELKKQAEGKFAAVVSERDAAVKKAQGPVEQHQSSGTGNEIQSLKDQLAGVQKDLSDAKSANQALQAKVQTAETGNISATGEIQTLKDKLVSAQKDFSSAQSGSQALENKLRTAENARISTSNEAQTLQRQLAAVQKDLSDAQIAKQELQNKAQAAETGNTSATSEVQGLQNKLVRLQKDLTDAHSANQILESKLQTAEHGNSSNNGEIQTLQNKVARLHKDFSEAQSTNNALQARVQTAETGYNSASNEIQDLKRQMQNAEATFSNVKNENGRLQREVNEAQKKGSDANEENQRLQSIVDQATEITKRYYVAKAKFNEMHANLKAAEAETKQLREAERALQDRNRFLDNLADQKNEEKNDVELRLKNLNSEYHAKLLEKDAQIEDLDMKLVRALRACPNCDHILWYGQCKNIHCELSDDYMFKEDFNAGNTEAAQNTTGSNAYAGTDLFQQHGVQTIDEGLGGATDPATDPAFWNVTAGQDLGEGTQSNMPPGQAMDTNEGPNDGAQSNVSTQAMDTSEGLRKSVDSVEGLSLEEQAEMDRTLDEAFTDTPPPSSGNPGTTTTAQQSTEDMEFSHDLYESFARLRKEDPNDQAFKPPVLSTFTFGSNTPMFGQTSDPPGSSDTSRSATTTRSRGTKRVARSGNSMSSARPTIDVPATTAAPAPSPSHVPGQRTCPNCGMWALKDDGQCPGNCY
ncbi:hypothetical protein KC340_g12978 [Hortaea werneckii]|nr:hypothetical protein KC342_g13196 [Hortaea werneckii]KAI7072664.1 hypothetical protein KC339_g14271 [Hortaea werneckii]KAI7224900.1 hypothetical protein KC365_g10348 [Hortaea werneckii]KAI7301732.1 hypothetical protein KC340_g12978 [Hortaea werneckii]KAI7388448.1 hypothetical protein KC328_g8937 [Hortaea werneckii]